MTSAELLALSDERDRHLELRLAAWREGYRAGLSAAAGEYDAGYAQAIADIKRVQHGIYDHFRQGAEVERRRWGPGGRERFAGPRPGGYRGRKASAA